MERIHKWNKEDTILTLYYVKFDLKNLPVKDEIELAEGIIGTSKSSLIMQGANIRYVLGYEEGVLDCFSDIQEQVVDEYNDICEEELRKICIDIISVSERDIDINKAKVRALQKCKLAEKKQKEKEKLEKEKLDAFFRSIGKDPNKMRKVST